ncbi:MAG TPA: phasin family protein [Magnetococcales bacterium]|nr:phasin family protein [Magnetococcales bacterium]
MVLQVAKRLSNAYFSFRHSVSDAQRIANTAVEKVVNLSMETSSDILSEGLSQLGSMKRVMTVPEIFAIQSDLWSQVGKSCLGHFQLSMEEVIEAQINLNNLVGHKLEDFSPLLQAVGTGLIQTKNR